MLWRAKNCSIYVDLGVTGGEWIHDFAIIFCNVLFSRLPGKGSTEKAPFSLRLMARHNTFFSSDKNRAQLPFIRFSPILKATCILEFPSLQGNLKEIKKINMNF